MNSNEWKLEGILNKKFAKSGRSKAGKSWTRYDLKVYAGKDKETGKPKYNFVSFFTGGEKEQFFGGLEDGTKVRLFGKPEARAYVDKEGELKASISMNLAYDNYCEIIQTPEEEDGYQQELNGVLDYSEEPF